jgi:serine protease AprX
MVWIILWENAFVKQRTSAIIASIVKRLFFLNTSLALGLAGVLFLAWFNPIRAVPANVAPRVWADLAATDDGEAEFIVVLTEQADLSRAAGLPNREARLRFVYDTLQETARRSQAPLRAELDASGVDYRSFYIVNALALRGDRALVTRLAARSDVARIAANPRVLQALPSPSLPTEGLDGAPASIEWNVARINADDVWALGYTGQGIVVAGQDTGYDWDHPAIKSQYRGWDGFSADHDYNWHDAIHSGGGVCGADSPEPCDDHGHGTHTMGTIVGDDAAFGGSNQIGVAPGARWIGCRNMDQGYGTPATYMECFEFFLAPYPVGGTPSEGDSTKAAHVINNSWVCPPSEGCDWDTLQATVENVRAAGIAVVVSAGNEGSSCNTVMYPPAIYDDAFSVGATNSSDAIASFSSRGPVTVDGSNRLKPDVSAPGVSIRSSQRGGGYVSMQGTSMAAPHVAGTVALLWSAAPHLIGDVDATEWIIARTARPRIDTSCGGGPGGLPNNVYGWGIVDALVAVEEVQVNKEAAFPPLEVPARTLVYTLTFTNFYSSSLTQVVLTDAIPTSTTFAWASGDYVYADGVVTWTAASLASHEALTATLAVTVAHLARGALVVNEAYGVRADELSAPIAGAPVEAVVPWRYTFPVVFRNWTPGPNGDD